MSQIDLENTIEATFGNETEPTSDAYTEIIDADISEDSLTELFDADIGEDMVEEIYETEVSDDMRVLEPEIVVNIPGEGGGKSYTLSKDGDTLNLLGSDGSASSVTSKDDKNFVYTQAVPSATWTIAHNLGKYPAVTIVDSANRTVEGECEYIDLNTVRLTFSGAFSGKAYIN